MLRTIAVKLASCGIAVKNIAPGLIEASIGQSLEKPAGQMGKALLGRLPGWAGQPEELAGLAPYLVSDASSYVIGSVFTDGGSPHHLSSLGSVLHDRFVAITVRCQPVYELALEL